MGRRGRGRQTDRQETERQTGTEREKGGAQTDGQKWSLRQSGDWAISRNEQEYGEREREIKMGKGT